MKKLIYNITLSLCLIFACNSVDPEPEPDDPLDIQANLLNGKWILKDESSAVKDGSIISDFKDITLTFSGGTKSGGNYATTNSIDADVWPNSGSWQFQNNDKKNIEDSDEKVLYFKKVISPTEIEMEMHKKYLKQNLKKNFFS